MGTGFNSKIIKDTSPKQKVSYLTPINFSPTNVAVVTHTMEQAQVVGKDCNQAYVQVTHDLAIVKIAYKIQSTSKPQFNNLFIHLGSFHLMMAFFKAIGVFINECGLSHMMIESNIIASGSVNGLVEGKHFNRCKRLHPLMALGLKMLHFDHFLDNIEYNLLKEQAIDDLLHYQEVIDSHSSMPTELPNNVLSRVLSAYQKFVEETRQVNLNKVDETHPGLKNYFMNGCFGIKRTDKPFSSIPIDLTLAQTINAEAARYLSGTAHFTNSLAALQRWTRSHSIRATIISRVLDVCGLKQLQDVSAD
ncbi:uncharacterized protein TNCV_1700921 [Trichonephila clavipes]|nr:uncharacterized protein TNCV_1700921 [Trichonephila clavipes]